MNTINIELTPELSGIVEQNIKTGLYKDAGDYIRDLIRNNQLYQEIIYQQKLRNLKKLLSKGIKDAEQGNYSAMTREDFLALTK